MKFNNVQHISNTPEKFGSSLKIRMGSACILYFLYLTQAIRARCNLGQHFYIHASQSIATVYFGTKRSSTFEFSRLMLTAYQRYWSSNAIVITVSIILVAINFNNFWSLVILVNYPFTASMDKNEEKSGVVYFPRITIFKTSGKYPKFCLSLKILEK